LVKVTGLCGSWVIEEKEGGLLYVKSIGVAMRMAAVQTLAGL
jgi:hypothetical protein